jgi:hypothetical protein
MKTMADYSELLQNTQIRSAKKKCRVSLNIKAGDTYSNHSTVKGVD